MRVYYYRNCERQQSLNREGVDYTPGYLAEMLSFLGVGAQPLDTRELLNGTLRAEDILLTGSEPLPDGFRAACMHIAFQTAGDLSAFGIEREGDLPKAGDTYDIDGYFLWSDGGRELPLPVISPFTVVRPRGAQVLAYARAGERTVPALLAYGDRYYFTFDLPATLWYTGDGRPLLEGKNSFSVGRVPDARPVPLSYDTRIAYADRYAYILQGLLQSRGLPLIHRLPPLEDGSAPDLLLYFSGDDDAGSAENNLQAFAAMEARGLPYHLNVMPADKDGRFVIDRDQQEDLLRRGCEVALHPDFHGISEYGEEGYRLQAAMFERAFGRKTVTAVNHCLIQRGSCADRLRSEQALGIVGDNNKFGEYDESDINAFNLWGYAFGTAFPRYTLDDAAHGNARIDVAEIPNTYYEPRLYTRSPENLEKLHAYIDQCAFWGRMGSLFTHPHYISGVLCPAEAAPALAAIDECLAYSDEKGYKLVKTAPDALARWWRDRAASRLSEMTPDGFVLDCEADGLLLRLPAGVDGAVVDGETAAVEKKTIEGAVCTLLAVRGRGRHRITYTGPAR